MVGGEPSCCFSMSGVVSPTAVVAVVVAVVVVVVAMTSYFDLGC
jgi:hypothetical protein